MASKAAAGTSLPTPLLGGVGGGGVGGAVDGVVAGVELGDCVGVEPANSQFSLQLFSEQKQYR